MFGSILTAAGLGLGSGVNAYATLLVFGLLSRWQPSMFPGDLAKFFSSTPVLIGIAVMYAMEFVADKIPAVDHVWDAVHTFIRPAAGALVAWASTSDKMPQGAVIVATVIAGTAALGAHATKAGLRATSTLTTAGTANPVLSVLEDIFAFVNAVLAILLPWIVLFIAFAVSIFFVRIKMSARRQPL